MDSNLSPLPPIVQFPEATWRARLKPEEWEACLESWIFLAGAHLSLPRCEFEQSSAKDDSLSAFIVSYVAQTASSNELLFSNQDSRSILIRKICFLLSHRLLELKDPPQILLRWDFLAEASKVFGRCHGKRLVLLVQKHHLSSLELSLKSLKTSLTKQLDARIMGDLKKTENDLKKLNHLLYASPETAAFFMAGSDFLDALITGHKLINPSLRKVILSNLYLCLLGLTESEKPNLSSLVDQLYLLKMAAEAHQAENSHANNSLISELVTVTPILNQIKERTKMNDYQSSRLNSILPLLENFRIGGRNAKTRRPIIKRRIDKGKQKATNVEAENNCWNDQACVHKMSLISQIQELLPDLGSGFIARLLSEYEDSAETVISLLLEESLPAHLKKLDHTEPLDTTQNATQVTTFSRNLVSDQIFPQLPARHNIFDDDDFDKLAVDTSRLHFGRQNDSRTAETILDDRSSAPNKAAIISALSAFDADDDERDDTYDISDVGGTVDSASLDDTLETAHTATPLQSAHDEILFYAYKANSQLFARDSATRRGEERSKLKQQVGLTDEAIEGWALMLSRDKRSLRSLETKFGCFTGVQRDLPASAWSKAGMGEDFHNSRSGPGMTSGGFRGRGSGSGGGGRRRGIKRGNVAGASTDRETGTARKGKEVNKGSGANHNRRDQRAKKMARGGFTG